MKIYPFYFALYLALFSMLVLPQIPLRAKNKIMKTIKTGKNKITLFVEIRKYADGNPTIIPLADNKI
jgi:hypothetical protein